MPGDVSDFTLDASTGIVRVNTDLDFETQQQYSIQVQATDGWYIFNVFFWMFKNNHLIDSLKELAWTEESVLFDSLENLASGFWNF